MKTALCLIVSLFVLSSVAQAAAIDVDAVVEDIVLVIVPVGALAIAFFFVEIQGWIFRKLRVWFYRD
jgi:opacity protein-like surface antigen